ncbi:LamB/YcsF family protein [Syntrophobacter fumaroxidans]|uniref:5-oxoprolinase subunit A n=1 Tax=Syntrophobacter fumaroxidans (strain DSM 10017 / MPOB) TaxID=335543 RepID=PXPA_SYNFM|nr:5-oxoprolinase subunit PxpA [Syntrophobacter fumaroxidans]A0LNR3.1 RecName: Full=5-oxoprolinase subunit A; Short=5-OPase subunit A; AltName: Full=5-oxoprolinase (ATP-hydrolyzing) subunit A [Syntrophobacter fumaroxidans MPOB]ABK19065.1 LamB/YcsF family protein [Syntrophobacter fumaroxidans MPOB]
MRTDINCDMGESFGSYRIGEDEKVMPCITSANVACGWHAGDPMIMARTLELAARHGVAVGAHPGYPDLLGYGRRNLETFPGEVRNYILYQIGALAAFAGAAGVKLQHVKPHGAMYNLAARDERTAKEVIEAVKAYDPGLILVTLAGSLCAQMAADAGLRVAAEVFPDRAYLTTGQLAPRSMPGAVIHDPEQVKERVLKLVRTGMMTSIDGRDLALRADTLCVHGDNPGACLLAASIREALETSGVRVVAMGAQ